MSLLPDYIFFESAVSAVFEQKILNKGRGGRGGGGGGRGGGGRGGKGRGGSHRGKHS